MNLSHEVQLAHSRDLMRYIIEHSNSAVAVFDRDLRYVYVSQRYMDDYRLKDRDIVGKHHYDVFPDLPAAWKEVHRLALEGKVCRGDRDPFLRDGELPDWIRWECRPWYDAEKNIGGIILYTEIITERVRAEEKLKETNRILTQLLDVANQLTSARTGGDVAGIIKRAARRLIGADGVAVVLREGGMCHYMDEDAVSPLWKGQRFPMDECISGWVMRNRQSAFIEDIDTDPRIPHDVYRKTFVKSLAITPIRSTDPIGAIGVYWSRKHAATEVETALLTALCNMADSVWDAMEKSRFLKERDELQRAMVESSPLPVISMDGQGNVLTWNSSAEKIFGWKAMDVIGRPLSVIPEEEKEAFEKLLTRVKEEGGFTGLEMVNQTKGGARILASLSTAPVFDERKNVIGIMVTIEDITGRKRAEEELRTLKDHLEKEVAEKTRELQKRIVELERFHDATIEREFRIKELRDENERLKGGGL